MMARTGGELAISHRAQFPAQRLDTDRNPKLLPHPLHEVDQSPTHNVMHGGVRAILHRLFQRLALLGAQPRRRARCLPVNEPVGSSGIEAQHPIANDLKRHASNPGRLAP